MIEADPFELLCPLSGISHRQQVVGVTSGDRSMPEGDRDLVQIGHDVAEAVEVIDIAALFIVNLQEPVRRMARPELNRELERTSAPIAG
ncbi:hypothetical protein [Bradyrhizobium sp. SZCCHNR1092]|uniref:hypothetical protein n=1 Tax=unclassified Bradyrhizobium TaxID=2631580 RepID=UPI0039670AE3